MTTIGTAARHAGCGVETIRYYERIGLLTPPSRAVKGQRSYGDGEVRRLQFIRRCRDLGFTLKEVAALLDLSGSASENCTRVRTLAEAQIDSVRRKVADLTRVEHWLTQMVEQCAAPEREGCPMIETLLDATPPAVSRCD